MKYFAGIDVSLADASVCVVDETGRVVAEGKVASEPELLVAFLAGTGRKLERVGLEAGPLSQWLYAGLAEAGQQVVCIETRHAKAALSAMTIKTDRKDARGIAQIIRTGWYRAVHVKTPASQELRMLLSGRKFLVRKLVAIKNEIRGILRGFGLKVGKAGDVGFERAFENWCRVNHGGAPSLKRCCACAPRSWLNMMSCIGWSSRQHAKMRLAAAS